MTLREKWAINRERRQLGLPEVDQNGQVIKPRQWKPLTEGERKMTKEWIKVATCTHCNKQIENVGGTWVHSEPEPGLKPIACTTINFATPQRGSVRKVA
jgi:hypothetical protein